MNLRTVVAVAVVVAVAIVAIVVISGGTAKGPGVGTKKGPDAKADTQRWIGTGFSLQKPKRYRVSKRATEVVFVDQKRPGAYTANIFIAKPPSSMLRRVRRCVIFIRDQNANDSACCRELAEGFASGARVRLRGARVIKVRWGRTCQIEAERSSIRATVLTTLMKTGSGHVVVVGHFGIGDAEARSVYGQLIASWESVE